MHDWIGQVAMTGLTDGPFALGNASNEKRAIFRNGMPVGLLSA
jgi:hypothetical protein